METQISIRNAWTLKIWAHKWYHFLLEIIPISSALLSLFQFFCSILKCYILFCFGFSCFKLSSISWLLRICNAMWAEPIWSGHLFSSIVVLGTCFSFIWSSISIKVHAVNVYPGVMSIIMFSVQASHNKSILNYVISISKGHSSILQMRKVHICKERSPTAPVIL